MLIIQLINYYLNINPFIRHQGKDYLLYSGIESLLKSVSWMGASKFTTSNSRYRDTNHTKSTAKMPQTGLWNVL